MLELIHTIINFIWSLLTLKLNVGGYDLSYFSVIVVSFVTGLLWKLIFNSKGGSNND